MKLTTFFIIAIACCGIPHKQVTVIRDDFKRYYDEFQVQGSFALYDPQKNSYTFYNRDQFNEPFTPASTFKICNSLIGIETGVITDENFIIHWDSTIYQIKNWNQDQDMKTAFKNSTVWYYRELARRVGATRMKQWLDKAEYGNRDTSGGVDLFWLRGGLRITPAQQIQFLKKLNEYKVPFSKRSVDIVRKIMIMEDTAGYVLRAKTGWGDEEKRMVGWYVGYIEKGNDVYYFTNCIQTTNMDHKEFARARVEIARKILDDLKLTDRKP